MEGVRHGTFADAHPPRENLVFTEKLWKGVPKSTPGSILGRFWHTLPRLFWKQRFRVEGVRHGTFADAHPPCENVVFFKKYRKGVQISNSDRATPLRAAVCAKHIELEAQSVLKPEQSNLFWKT